jgi:hypothetical protein
VRGSEGQRATQGRVALRELEVQGGRHVEVGEYEAGKVGGGVVLWGEVKGVWGFDFEDQAIWWGLDLRQGQSDADDTADTLEIGAVAVAASADRLMRESGCKSWRQGTHVMAPKAPLPL